jgi:hypothetical protein
MSDYLKSTNFATKDSLPSGNAGKIVKGTEIDNEFNAIADAIESKADLLNPTFSGLLTTDTLTTGGATNIGGTLSVAGAVSAADDVQFTGTGRVKVPTGTTAQRPTGSAGSLRYNTTLGYLENYTGTEWRAVGYVTPADVSDKENTSTGHFQLPKGNIAQRPVSPVEGLIRYNAETDIYEGYINGDWHQFLTVNQGVYTISYLAVGGGSGGNSWGGAAGQVTTSTTTAVPGVTVLTMTIGAGGSGSTNGNASVVTGVVSAIGGNANGTSGNGYTKGNAVTHDYGEGNGGTGYGGGGGAGGNGGGGSTNDSQLNLRGGDGGTGVESIITGVTTRWAGGGGGAAQGPGGNGVDGGGNGNFSAGANGTPNTGGGGGGAFYGGAQGGSGCIILKMPTVNYTGTHTGSPTISTTGSFTVLKYTGSGTYTC